MTSPVHMHSELDRPSTRGHSQIDHFLQKETLLQYPNLMQQSHFYPEPQSKGCEHLAKSSSKWSCSQSDTTSFDLTTKLASDPTESDCSFALFDEDQPTANHKHRVGHTYVASSQCMNRMRIPSACYEQSVTTKQHRDEKEQHQNGQQDCDTIDLTFSKCQICLNTLPCQGQNLARDSAKCKILTRVGVSTASQENELKKKIAQDDRSDIHNGINLSGIIRPTCSSVLQSPEDMADWSDAGEDEEPDFDLRCKSNEFCTDIHSTKLDRTPAKKVDTDISATVEEDEEEENDGVIIFGDKHLNNGTNPEQSCGVTLEECRRSTPKSPAFEVNKVSSSIQQKEVKTHSHSASLVGHEKSTAQWQDSDVRDEKTQQQVLWCLKKLSGQVMFVLSQFNYRSYLNNPDYAEVVSAFPRPVDLKSENKHRGDFDILIIHREYGFIVAEIKSVGNNFSELGMPVHMQDAMVEKRIRQCIKQLHKAKDVLNHLVSDLDMKPMLKKTVILPNISNAQLTRVLRNSPQLTGALSDCFGTLQSEEVSHYCLTADDVNDPSVWWQRLVASGDLDPAMTDSLYLEIVSRFAGPATSLSEQFNSPAPSKSQPKGDALPDKSTEGKTKSQSKGKSKSSIVCLVGHPGTGKTTMLIQKGRKMLKRGFDVQVLSCPCINLLRTSMLEQQLMETAGEGIKEKVHIHTFCLACEETDRAKKSLCKEVKGGSLVVITDDVCDKGCMASLIQLLQWEVPDLHFYAASNSEVKSPFVKTVHMAKSLRSKRPPIHTHSVRVPRRHASLPSESSALFNGPEQIFHHYYARYHYHPPVVRPLHYTIAPYSSLQRASSAAAFLEPTWAPAPTVSVFDTSPKPSHQASPTESAAAVYQPLSYQQSQISQENTRPFKYRISSPFMQPLHRAHVKPARVLPSCQGSPVVHHGESSHALHYEGLVNRPNTESDWHLTEDQNPNKVEEDIWHEPMVF